MALSINRVQVLGHLGKDPDVKTLPNSGQKVANFSVATDESYVDKNNQKVDRTEWHRCVAWGGWADGVQQYAQKGTKVFIEGKLQTRSWESNGQKHYSTEIVVEKLVVMSPPKSSGAGSSAQPAQQRPAAMGPGLTPAGVDDLPF